MTRDEIIKLAREAGFGPAVAWKECTPPFERFAALVVAAVYENEDMFTEAYAGGFAAGAAAEREACAKVCEDEARMHEHLDRNGRSRHLDDAAVAETCAAAIRARVPK
jgi:hypothetical protein